jgi:hypothetical protein
VALLAHRLKQQYVRSWGKLTWIWRDFGFDPKRTGRRQKFRNAEALISPPICKPSNRGLSKILPAKPTLGSMVGQKTRVTLAMAAD